MSTRSIKLSITHLPPWNGFVQIRIRGRALKLVVVSEMELKVPPRLDERFRELRVLERNKKAFEVKALAVADYIGRFTYRATAGKLTGFLEPVSKSAVWYWVRSEVQLAKGRRRRSKSHGCGRDRLF